VTHLILVGLRGSGKTAAGRRAAELLGYTFVDLDELIEARGRTIPEIFAADGEAGFRKIECEVIQALEPTTETVVATGGGGVLDEGNRRKLDALGLVVYLHAAPEVLAARISDSDRPRLAGSDALEETRLILETRESLYRALAQHAVDTGALDVDGVAARLVELARGTAQGNG